MPESCLSGGTSQASNHQAALPRLFGTMAGAMRALRNSNEGGKLGFRACLAGRQIGFTDGSGRRLPAVS
jgi:hypothetical protein